ncbi:MAG: 16S rRNA (cytosine(967)-C(5))-methyltransferase RsmB [Lachnospiraceae bacterium]|nr:16S rRNA (cytosine(967)-C(5))-methyltransferase RsmB [Lachnospiraceae bacterium]
MEDVRAIILETLLTAEKQKSGYEGLLKDILFKYSYLEKSRRSFINRTVRGCVERQIELDYIIDRFSKTPCRKLRPQIRAIFRMSVYQLKYMDNVPDSAVCNEAVRLAGAKGFKNLKGYVNAVLRNIAGHINEIIYPDKEKDPINYMRIRYSCDETLIRLLIKQYGEETAEAVLRESLGARPIFIRCNTSRISPDELAERLKKEGMEVCQDGSFPEIMTIDGFDLLDKSEAFSEGLFNVQDKGSFLVTLLAGIKKGDRVLDVCAAPGGKTCHAADILNGTGIVISRDVSEQKVSLIRDNVKRCGFTNIRAEVFDALKEDREIREDMDVVICDLPCSGSGVLSRKPDIKFRTDERALDELKELQRNILKTVSSYVKRGGILIFSTCTLNKEENEENASWIRDNLPFEPVPIENEGLRKYGIKTLERGYMQLIPGIHDTDGFFISKFKRI